MNFLIDHLAMCNNVIFQPSGLQYTMNPVKAPEGEAYGACSFELNHRAICFRIAKITPKKKGQFVTLLERSQSGTIIPFDETHIADLFVVSVCDDRHFGLCIFPKSALCHKGIISCQGKTGKLAMRVYPPWVQPSSKQGVMTQRWQIECFLDASHGNQIDLERARFLFGY